MKKNGFTLIELLATLALLAILSMVIVPSIIGVINKSSSIEGKSKDEVLQTLVDVIVLKKQLDCMYLIIDILWVMFLRLRLRN